MWARLRSRSIQVQHLRHQGNGYEGLTSELMHCGSPGVPDIVFITLIPGKADGDMHLLDVKCISNGGQVF